MSDKSEGPEPPESVGGAPGGAPDPASPEAIAHLLGQLGGLCREIYAVSQRNANQILALSARVDGLSARLDKHSEDSARGNGETQRIARDALTESAKAVVICDAVLARFLEVYPKDPESTKEETPPEGIRARRPGDTDPSPGFEGNS